MRRSSKSTELSRRRFLRNAAGWALGAGGILVPRLIRASAFTDNVTQYLGAQPNSAPVTPLRTPDGWWIFAGNQNDSSGNGATLTNTNPFYENGYYGTPNTACGIGFGGTYAHVNAPACNNYTSFTVSFWAYQYDCGNANGTFIQKEFKVYGNAASCTLGNSQFAELNQAFPVTAVGTWAHYCFTGTGGSSVLSAYYNGSLYGMVGGGVFSGATTTDLMIGNTDAGPGTFSMDIFIQDLRFWNSTVASDGQVSLLYSTGPS